MICTTKCYKANLCYKNNNFRNFEKIQVVLHNLNLYATITFAINQCCTKVKHGKIIP